MRRLTLEILAAAALTLAAIIASAHGVMASGVLVQQAFARASATPMATAGVVYATIANRGQAADRLISIATPAAAMASLHETRDENGTTSMAPVSALDLPAGATVVLKPGGLHIMLMQLRAPLKQGTTIRLDFTFEKSGMVGVEVPVKGVAASAP